MGSQPSYNKPQPSNDKKKIVIHLRNRTIIIHNSYKMSMQIADVAVFPHGCQGLRLWDTDIIGTRYIIMNHNLFVNRDVFVVNGRTGVCGIAFRKWTKCRSVVITDFNDQVVGNIRRNCEKNGIKTSNYSVSKSKQEAKTDSNNQATVYRLNFGQIKNYSSKYDIIFIVDGFCKGFPVKQLYELFKRFLRMQGKAVVIVPQREDDRQKFFTYIKQQNILTSSLENKGLKQVGQKVQQEYPFSFEIRQTDKKLLNQQYFTSPLPNQVQGMSQFPLIDQLDYTVFQIIKKSQDQIPSPIKVIKEESPKRQQLEKKQQKVLKVQQSTEVENKSKKQQKVEQVKELQVQQTQKQQKSQEKEQQRQQLSESSKKEVSIQQQVQSSEQQQKADENQQQKKDAVQQEQQKQNLKQVEQPKQATQVEIGRQQPNQPQLEKQEQADQKQIQIQQASEQQKQAIDTQIEKQKKQQEIKVEQAANSQQDQQATNVQVTEASENNKQAQQGQNSNIEQTKVQPVGQNTNIEQAQVQSVGQNMNIEQVQVQPVGQNTNIEQTQAQTVEQPIMSETKQQNISQLKQQSTEDAATQHHAQNTEQKVEQSNELDQQQKTQQKTNAGKKKKNKKNKR